MLTYEYIWVLEVAAEFEQVSHITCQVSFPAVCHRKISFKSHCKLEILDICFMYSYTFLITNHVTERDKCPRRILNKSTLSHWFGRFDFGQIHMRTNGHYSSWHIHVKNIYLIDAAFGDKQIIQYMLFSERTLQPLTICINPERCMYELEPHLLPWYWPEGPWIHVTLNLTNFAFPMSFCVLIVIHFAK